MGIGEREGKRGKVVHWTGTGQAKMFNPCLALIMFGQSWALCSVGGGRRPIREVKVVRPIREALKKIRDYLGIFPNIGWGGSSQFPKLLFFYHCPKIPLKTP